MSLLKPKMKNPVVRYYDWSGTKGKWKYYDKAEEEEVLLDQHIHIVIVDTLSTITGFNKQFNTGIFSNEVRSLADENLKVMARKGNHLLCEGTYRQIKAGMSGGKFAKAVYAVEIKAAENGAVTFEPVKFTIAGSALGVWFDKKIEPEWQIISLLPSNEDMCRENGTVVYYLPRIRKHKMQSKLVRGVTEAAQKIESYLEYREKRIFEECVAQEELDDTESAANDTPEENDLPL